MDSVVSSMLPLYPTLDIMFRGSEQTPLPIKGSCADAHKLDHACQILQDLTKQN